VPFVTLYETLFVVHPERGTRIKEFVERFKKVIEGQNGTLAQVDEWGMRDLAYRIDKQSKGHYVLLRYNATGRAVEELERNLKLTDGILRYLTVRVQENISIGAADMKGHADQSKPGSEVEGTKTEPVA
jgi:small subunit ribosomal protein S6